MTFEQKKEHAIAIMESKHMWKSNYAPPLIKGLWKLGLKIRPLPFMPFWQSTLITGIFFGPLYGLFMWFSVWENNGMAIAVAISMSVMAGILFGIGMAIFNWWLKTHNNLPTWDEL